MDIFRTIFGPGRKDWVITENPIPEDCQIVRVMVDPLHSSPDVISIFATSESFPDLQEGGRPFPEHIQIRTLTHLRGCKCECGGVEPPPEAPLDP